MTFPPVGQDGNHRPECKNPCADPHPHHEGIYVDPEHGGAVGVRALIQDIEVFAQAGTDCDFGRSLLVLSFVVDVPLRPHRTQAFVSLVHAQLGLYHDRERIPGLGSAFVHEPVAAEGRGLAMLQCRLDFPVERVSGESEEEEDDAEVDDVTAVTTAVSDGERPERFEIRLL